MVLIVFNGFRGDVVSYSLCKYVFCESKCDNVHDGVYSVQHRVIKCVSDLRQVGGFLFYLFCSSIVINTVIVTAGTFEA